MKTVLEIENELNVMKIGVNCTHEEYTEKCYERMSAILQEEIDKEIVDYLVKIGKEYLELKC